MTSSQSSEAKVTQLRTLLDGIGNKFFYVHFIKRSDKSVRKMLCLNSLATEKGKSGKGQSFDPKEKGLYTVIDISEVQKKTKAFGKVRTEEQDNEIMKACFRSIPLENVTKLVAQGKVLYEE